ncbi:MAG TPA: ankyrin repeat domain-containing protein, partial [Candidatus Handelsmanbacteria bacterium]|nr:ankyrin repeat domain-containing protein [Candidatus Handelsmanbacteria bacterium]
MLHKVAYDSQLEKAQLLLLHGADIDAIDEESRSTPLELAARAQQIRVGGATTRARHGPDVGRSGMGYAFSLGTKRRERGA